MSRLGVPLSVWVEFVAAVVLEHHPFVERRSRVHAPAVVGIPVIAMRRIILIAIRSLAPAIMNRSLSSLIVSEIRNPPP